MKTKANQKRINQIQNISIKRRLFEKRVLPKAMAPKLEKFLFPEGMPKHYPPLKKSPELLTIFHLLFSLGYDSEIAAMDGFEIASSTAHSLEERIRAILNADTRRIITYKCHTNFTIKGMEFTPMAELPLYQTVLKARQVYAGDLLLVRRDEKTLKETGTAELQILTNGLYGSDQDDWRHFTGTLVDISQITKYSTLERQVEYGNIDE